MRREKGLRHRERGFQRSSSSHRRWLLSIGILIVALFVAISFVETYLKVFQLKQEATKLAEERRELQRQNAQLREEIKLLQRPEYVEKLARERLGLVKPGEIALRIVETPSPVESPQERPKGDHPKRWWEKVLRR
ncbi:MAG: cell division protein FtsL [Armatimonadota bacterium]|nr:cell division protein FtsL [Armatimonadota bacterium]